MVSALGWRNESLESLESLLPGRSGSTTIIAPVVLQLLNLPKHGMFFWASCSSLQLIGDMGGIRTEHFMARKAPIG